MRRRTAASRTHNFPTPPRNPRLSNHFHPGKYAWTTGFVHTSPKERAEHPRKRPGSMHRLRESCTLSQKNKPVRLTAPRGRAARSREGCECRAKKIRPAIGLTFGAENETRTRDPNLGKVVLYQLSYFRMLVLFWDCKGTQFFETSKLF